MRANRRQKTITYYLSTRFKSCLSLAYFRSDARLFANMPGMKRHVVKKNHTRALMLFNSLSHKKPHLAIAHQNGCTPPSNFAIEIKKRKKIAIYNPLFVFLYFCNNRTKINIKKQQSLKQPS